MFGCDVELVASNGVASHARDGCKENMRWPRCWSEEIVAKDAFILNSSSVLGPVKYPAIPMLM